MNTPTLSVDELYALQVAQTGPLELHGVKTRRFENGLMITRVGGHEVSRVLVSQPTNYKPVTLADLNENEGSDDEREHSVAPPSASVTPAAVAVGASSSSVSVATVVPTKSVSRGKKSVVAVCRRPITRSMGLTVRTRSQLKADKVKSTRRF